ncbi:MAG: hypothetical protein WBI55_02355 [Eubacteriales bacterium]|nr:hypothetical protein [Clostridiales bacterium]
MELYKASGALNRVNSTVGDIIYIAFIVLNIFAILRVLRGKDADLPFLSKMSGVT